MSLTHQDFLREMADKNHWPLKIHSRGYDATLVDVQPLNRGEPPAPIYRFPGGDSLVDDLELRMPAYEFHRLQKILEQDPRALDFQRDLFRRQPTEWYKELALYAMKVLSETFWGPGQFNGCRQDLRGWAAHYITKTVFEEQDLFDAYHDEKFIREARSFLPWYIDRYTGNEEGAES